MSIKTPKMVAVLMEFTSRLFRGKPVTEVRLRRANNESHGSSVPVDGTEVKNRVVEYLSTRRLRGIVVTPIYNDGGNFYNFLVLKDDVPKIAIYYPTSSRMKSFEVRGLFGDGPEGTPSEFKKGDKNSIAVMLVLIAKHLQFGAVPHFPPKHPLQRMAL